MAAVPCSVFRASDELGHVIAVYVSPRRDTEAATRFLTQAMERTECRPHTATTDKAAIYPPALRSVLPEILHLTGKQVQQAIERDHQHLKGRYRSMRGFKQLHTAQTVCSRHGFVRHLRQGFYRLGLVMGNPRIPCPPCVLLAWDELTQQLQAA